MTTAAFSSFFIGFGPVETSRLYYSPHSAVSYLHVPIVILLRRIILASAKLLTLLPREPS